MIIYASHPNNLADRIKFCWEHDDKATILALLADMLHYYSNNVDHKTIACVAIKVGNIVGRCKTFEEFRKEIQEFDPGYGFPMLRS